MVCDRGERETRTLVDVKRWCVEEPPGKQSLEAGLVERVGGLVDGGRHFVCAPVASVGEA